MAIQWNQVSKRFMKALEKINSAVARGVVEGLSKKHKSLPSWLFYDAEGDKIFQKIMAMPEYYLTNAEHEIFEKQKESILNSFSSTSKAFNIIEFGAGDGLKTEVLLKHFSNKDVDFTYRPVDISASVLGQLKARMQRSIPTLKIDPINAEYFDALAELNVERKNPVIVLFMGANIGNFHISDAELFVKKIADALKPGDQFMIGFDLKKDPNLIIDAYCDAAGITTAFNMNLLERLNRELGSDFDLSQFIHYPYYDPQTGTAKSFLVSQKEQDVHFEELDKTFHFKAWEPIHVEFSQKFDEEMIRDLAIKADLKVEKYFYDEREYFADVLLKK
jgi:L-histidine N-alpha-methyltransferase